MQKKLTTPSKLDQGGPWSNINASHTPMTRKIYYTQPDVCKVMALEPIGAALASYQLGPHAELQRLQHATGNVRPRIPARIHDYKTLVFIAKKCIAIGKDRALSDTPIKSSSPENRSAPRNARTFSDLALI